MGEARASPLVPSELGRASPHAGNDFVVAGDTGGGRVVRAARAALSLEGAARAAVRGVELLYLFQPSGNAGWAILAA